VIEVIYLIAKKDKQVLQWLFQCLTESLVQSLSHRTNYSVSFSLIDYLTKLNLSDNSSQQQVNLLEFALKVFDSLSQSAFLFDSSNDTARVASEHDLVEFISHLLDTFKVVLNHLNSSASVSLSENENVLLFKIAQNIIDLAVNDKARVFSNWNVIFKCSLVFKEFTLR
jgi:hypothetical protein